MNFFTAVCNDVEVHIRLQHYIIGHGDEFLSRNKCPCSYSVHLVNSIMDKELKSDIFLLKMMFISYKIYRCAR